jgi:hypothetical protein
MGADKFTCGEGNDSIRDYGSKEGDVILDRQNCEKSYSKFLSKVIMYCKEVLVYHFTNHAFLVSLNEAPRI